MVRFISFLSTMTARATDSNLEEEGKKRKKEQNEFNCPPRNFFFFFHSKNLSKQTITGMKLQSGFRRKEKLTNHLVINAAAHQGLAGTAHSPRHAPHRPTRPRPPWRFDGCFTSRLQADKKNKKQREWKERNKTRPR